MQIAFRAMTKIRGALVTSIYKKMLTVRAETTNSSAAVSLMSTDVDRIVMTTFMGVNLGPDVVQIVVALCIMGTQIGPTAVAPVVLCGICIGIAAKIGQLVPPRQRRWMSAIQKRVGITADIIGAMKGVKVAGLSVKVDRQIQGLRNFELERSVQFRKLQVTTQLLGKLLPYDEHLVRLLTVIRYIADSLNASCYIHSIRNCTESFRGSSVQRHTSIHLA
jgi:ATP-binding cassette subfamily C (CFTR/MRP) protein 1